jgi:hypothetical protein
MLGNQVFTVLGVAIGVGFAFRNRGTGRNIWRPFIISISVGSFTDLLYGYCGNCRILIEEYDAMKRIHKEANPVNKS